MIVIARSVLRDEASSVSLGTRLLRTPCPPLCGGGALGERRSQ
jgi:hypothetical protein